MTFRIDGGKKPGHLRTTSEEKASEAQPVPRVSKVSRKHHTRTPSLSRQEKTGRSQSDSEKPATSRRPDDDHDLADDGGSDSGEKPSNFDGDTLKFPDKMPPLPSIPGPVPRLKMPTAEKTPSDKSPRPEKPRTRHKRPGEGVDLGLKRLMFRTKLIVRI